MNRYYIQVTCDKKSNIHRGLVKWYDRGLQNLWWEFDSLIPCSLKTPKQVFFLSFVFQKVSLVSMDKLPKRYSNYRKLNFYKGELYEKNK